MSNGGKRGIYLFPVFEIIIGCMNLKRRKGYLYEEKELVSHPFSGTGRYLYGCDFLISQCQNAAYELF